MAAYCCFFFLGGGVSDWSMNKGSNLNRPGQSMLTLNLTSAAPVLIGRSNHHANNAASTEMTDTQESQFNGQTDDVSLLLKSPTI